MYIPMMVHALLTDYYKKKKQTQNNEVLNPVENTLKDLPDNK